MLLTRESDSLLVQRLPLKHSINQLLYPLASRGTQYAKTHFTRTKPDEMLGTVVEDGGHVVVRASLNEEAAKTAALAIEQEDQ
jgi:hypothetical protein